MEDTTIRIDITETFNGVYFWRIRTQIGNKITEEWFDENNHLIYTYETENDGERFNRFDWTGDENGRRK